MIRASKRNMSPQALALVAARFKVLSEPLRLCILQALENGEMSVSGITEAVESSQPNVSKHLKMLLDAGLIVRRQEGNTVYYSIADETVFELCEVVCSSLRERIEAHAGAFGHTVVPSRRRA
jgi:DNA-binding transcriptional ArsR family regulator